jgi:broad specificity phosphatase PhoE
MQAPVTKAITYVRHAESTANVTRQLSHAVDGHSLTGRGVSQARALADELAYGLGEIGSPIFASPLQRAVETAGIVARRLGREVAVVEALREIDVGELDGRNDAAAWAIYDAIMASWYAGALDVAFTGGEDGLALVARFQAGLGHVAAEATGQPVVVIGHGGILRVALRQLVAGSGPCDIELANCGAVDLLLAVDHHPGRADLPGIRLRRRRDAGLEPTQGLEP